MRAHNDPNPLGTGTFGLALFLASLGMLFVAGLLAYALIRLGGRFSPPPGSIRVPAALWASTLAMLVSSLTMHHALACVRHEKQPHFRRSLTATLVLALVFLAIQSPALAHLLRQHRALAGGNVHLYGLMFVLILLHAAHVVGGLLPLAATWRKALRGGYDHENCRPVKHLAMYWHFLDGVWLVMFITLLALA